MNDFTKGELQIILCDMQFYAANTKFKVLGEAVAHVELREKVERMIDNYCEHEYTSYDGYVECKKCTARIE